MAAGTGCHTQRNVNELIVDGTLHGTYLDDNNVVGLNPQTTKDLKLKSIRISLGGQFMCLIKV